MIWRFARQRLPCRADLQEHVSPPRLYINFAKQKVKDIQYQYTIVIAICRLLSTDNDNFLETIVNIF